MLILLLKIIQRIFFFFPKIRKNKFFMKKNKNNKIQIGNVSYYYLFRKSCRSRTWCTFKINIALVYTREHKIGMN